VINGAADIGAGDPTDPPNAPRIDLNDLDAGSGISGDNGDFGSIDATDGPTPDGLARTITFRDVDVSPDNTPNPPAAFGTVLNSSVVTLFASDCSTYSMHSFPVSTVVGQSDTLSQVVIDILHDIDFATPPTGGDAWVGALIGTNGGSTDDTGGNGLCMTAPLTGSNFPFYVSPDGFIDITDETIYRVTANLNVLLPASPAANTLPILEFVFDNFNSGLAGGNNYGGYAHLLDNSGGANGVGRVTNEFIYFVAPASNQASQWQAHVGDPAADDMIDLRLSFRLNDSTHSIGGGNDADEGTICVETVKVEGINRGLFAQEASVPIVVSDSNFVVGGPGDNIGTGTQTALNPGWDVSVQVSTGTIFRQTFFPVVGGVSNTTFTNAELFPVLWEAGKVYRTRIGMHYPNAADVASNNVMGAMLINMDTPQSEIGIQWNIQRGTGISVGKASPDATLAEYEAYMYSQQGTLSATPDADRVRGSMQMYEFGQFGGHGANAETGVLSIQIFAIDTLTNP
jgi:hypothetical protein